MTIVIIILSAFALLAIVLLVRTLACREHVYEPVTPPVMEIDSSSAARKLSGAVKIKTIACDDISSTDMNAFKSFAGYLEKSFPAVQRVMDLEVINGASLLYRWKGKDKAKKPVLFCAHIDVVPVEEGTEGDWEYPPFSGHIGNGHVWGRGTQDIKNQLVALLEAAEIMIGQGFIPERDIYFAFGHDEETRRNDGADEMAALLKDRGVSLEFVLDEGGSVTDNAAGGVSRPVAFIGIAEKGFVNVHLYARAEGGHSSMPPVHTAAGKIGRALAAIEANQCRLALTAPVREMLRALAPAMGFGNRLVISNLWLFEPLFKKVFAKTPMGSAFLRTTMAPTMLSGSDAPNVLPLSVTAVVNARILHGESSQMLRTHIGNILDDSTVSIDMQQVYEPSKISPVESYGFSSIAGVIRSLWPDAIITPYLVVGGTDARKYEGLTDCVYRFTPVHVDNSELVQVHGTDEHISIRNLEDSIRFYTGMFRV